ncbi:ABC transporter substrate-binding protein [Roseomonas sp. BN140053]|uniref:ABC transporter substrate-binding protein n=1 Tax=Roseomonas sp. BN140053 TaxID=3391898 RepID=UPI0039EACE14
MSRAPWRSAIPAGAAALSSAGRAAVLAAGLLGAGLAGAGTARAQVLEVAVDASPAGLDPHIATAFATFTVVNGTVYEGLTAIGEDLRVVPGLAQSWTTAEDGRTWRFTLRPGLRFHDGSAVTAEDVAASVRRVQSPAIASPLASRLAAVQAVRAVDAGTVEFSLSEASAPLAAALSGIAIVPRSAEADREGLGRAPMGTGPFRFTEWQPNGYVLLSRNENYWQAGLPKLAGIRFNIVPEAATRLVGLNSGQYALLPGVDAATAQQLRGRRAVTVHETLELAYTLVGMNTSRPPFNDPKVREALNFALNRQEIVDAALFGAGVPGGPLSPALREWALPVSEFPCYRPDPARARALLREAGITTPIRVTMSVLPRQDIRDIAQVVQQQLNAVGFQVELRNQELGQFIQDWRNSNFDLFASTNAGSVDPDDYFFRAFRTGGSTNVFKYSDPALDALLDRARTLGDQAARKAAYDEVQRRLACTGPVAHLAYPTLFTPARATLDGFEILANRSLASLRSASLPAR